MIAAPHLSEAMKKYPGQEWKNLYEETLRSIDESNHTPDNISWIGTRNGEYAISWKEYQQISDFTYYSGFGGTNIPRDLIVVFTDRTWLERCEYDGEEWWQYVSIPEQSPSANKFTLTINKERSVIGPRYEITGEQENDND